MTPEQFRSDLTVPPEVIGTPANLSSFLAQLSSQRGLMEGSNAQQIVVVEGAETAKIQSGYETKTGKFEFSKSIRDQDIQIIRVIPKFRSRVNTTKAKNPTLLVVYMGADDRKIGYFEVESYTALSSGFGYINKQMNLDKLEEGQFIDKEMKFTTSPNHQGDLYNLGVNTNVCHLPHWASTEDAFVISESMKAKLRHTVIDTAVINTSIDSVALNIYGDENTYMCCPNVGEQVREDGLLMAFRTRNKSTFLTDMTAAALRRPSHLHDDLVKAPAGATIIDIKIFTNHKRRMELSADPTVSQLIDYQDQYDTFWAAIIDTYEELKRAGSEFTPAFNTLVTKCKGWCYHRGGKTLTLMNKKEPVDSMRIEITYAYTREVNRGYKLVGRSGDKGVISDIYPDDWMPLMADGTRADIIVTAASPFNRLIGGLYYEQFINYAGSHALRMMDKKFTVEQRYEYMIDFIKEIRPIYAEYVKTRTLKYKDDFVEAIEKHGFYHIIPQFSSAITPEMFIRIADKYNIKRTNIKYKARAADGSVREITTCTDALIGSKYVWLLGKYPIDQCSAISFGYQNQLQIPIKPNSRTAKLQSLFGQTPIRYGEDETSILSMSCGAEFAARFLCLYSNSPVALKKLMRLLLTSERPSSIRNIGMTTSEMIDTAANVAVLKHELAGAGYELKIIDEPEGK